MANKVPANQQPTKVLSRNKPLPDETNHAAIRIMLLHAYEFYQEKLAAQATETVKSETTTEMTE